LMYDSILEVELFSSSLILWVCSCPTAWQAGSCQPTVTTQSRSAASKAEEGKDQIPVSVDLLLAHRVAGRVMSAHSPCLQTT